MYLVTERMCVCQCVEGTKQGRQREREPSTQSTYPPSPSTGSTSTAATSPAAACCFTISASCSQRCEVRVTISR